MEEEEFAKGCLLPEDSGGFILTSPWKARSIRRQSPGGGIRVSEARDSLEPGAPASLWRGLGKITASLLLEGTQDAGWERGAAAWTQSSELLATCRSEMWGAFRYINKQREGAMCNDKYQAFQGSNSISVFSGVQRPWSQT